jgi:hypothetical protein
VDYLIEMDTAERAKNNSAEVEEIVGEALSEAAEAAEET